MCSVRECDVELRPRIFQIREYVSWFSWVLGVCTRISMYVGIFNPFILNKNGQIFLKLGLYHDYIGKNTVEVKMFCVCFIIQYRFVINDWTYTYHMYYKNRQTELILKAQHHSFKGWSRRTQQSEELERKQGASSSWRPRWGFKEGLSVRCGEVRQLRAENGVSGFGVLFQGVGRDWGDKAGSTR